MQGKGAKACFLRNALAYLQLQRGKRTNGGYMPKTERSRVSLRFSLGLMRLTPENLSDTPHQASRVTTRERQTRSRCEHKRTQDENSRRLGEDWARPNHSANSRRRGDQGRGMASPPERTGTPQAHWWRGLAFFAGCALDRARAVGGLLASRSRGMNVPPGNARQARILSRQWTWAASTWWLGATA